MTIMPPDPQPLTLCSMRFQGHHSWRCQPKDQST